MNDPHGPILPDPYLHLMQKPPEKRGGPWLAIVTGLCVLLFAVGAGVGLWLFRREKPPLTGAAPGPGSVPVAPVQPPIAEAPEPPASPAPGLPPASAAPSTSSSAGAALLPGVPAKTVETKRGAITVVDLGVHTQKALSDEIAAQRAQAQAAGQTLLVMITEHGHKLFHDFDATLGDALMQSALANVRLVRVDLRYFEGEIEEMGLPGHSHPWFVLIGADLSPRDGINGGEWGEDTARNIAPVLGAFLKGTFKARREQWKPPRRKGVQL